MSVNQELAALVQRLEAVAVRLEKSQPGSAEGKLYNLINTMGHIKYKQSEKVFKLFIH